MRPKQLSQNLAECLTDSDSSTSIGLVPAAWVLRLNRLNSSNSLTQDVKEPDICIIQKGCANSSAG